MKNKSFNPTISTVADEESVSAKLRLTDGEYCSLFDILLFLGGERSLLRDNGLLEDYDSIMKKLELVDTKIHNKERSRKQIENWAKRKEYRL